MGCGVRALFLKIDAAGKAAACIVLFVVLLLRVPVSGTEAPHLSGFIMGAGAGYATVAGYYGPYFSSGYSVSLSGYYPLTFLHEYVLGEGELKGSRFLFDSGSGSSLETASVRAGAAVYYPVHRFFYPYGGLMVQESVLRFTAERLGERETSFKPGGVIQAGFFSWITPYAGTRLGVEYEGMPVSGKLFSAVTISASAMYRFRGGPASSQSKDPGADFREVNALYLNGVRAMRARDHLKAKRSFEELLGMDRNHELARRHLEKIHQSEKVFRDAAALEKERRYYDAISKYSIASDHIAGADERLGALRGMLIGKVPGMERRGIRAYEKKEYGECIAVMKKILLIDPGNNTATLYLPRAERRKQAIERLK